MDSELEKILQELPGLTAGKGIKQNEFHDYDVYRHTLIYVDVLKGMTADKNVLTAGYLHDIGKPPLRTTKQKLKSGEYDQFEGHDKIGEEIVRQMDHNFFQRFGLDQEKIAKLVGTHHIPMDYIKEMRKTDDWSSFETKYNEFISALENTGLPTNEVMMMFLADSLAKGRCDDLDELKLVREVVLNKGKDLKEVYELQKKVYGGKK
jgi:putative nucleotidyltransferase with HDIG domain